MKQKELGEKAVKKYESKAKEYLNDKEKAHDLLSKAMDKANKNQGPIGEMWEKLQLLFSIFKDWISGEYKEIPTGSIIMIIIAILYFVSPVDLIPDFIPGAGYVDDALVIAFVISQINADLENYKQWKLIRVAG